MQICLKKMVFWPKLVHRKQNKKNCQSGIHITPSIPDSNFPNRLFGLVKIKQVVAWINLLC